MRGSVLKYDHASGEGLVSGDDGHRYTFDRNAWQARGKPRQGAVIDFVAEGSHAREIIPTESTPGFSILFGVLGCLFGALSFISAPALILVVLGLPLAILSFRRARRSGNRIGFLFGLGALLINGARVTLEVVSLVLHLIITA